MKKKFIALMLLAALSLNACGGGEQKSSETPVAQESSAESSQEKSSEESAAVTEAPKESQSEAEASSSEEKKADDHVFELGEKVEFDTFDITIKSFSIVKDTDGKPALKFVYDWTNKGEKAGAPFMSFSLKGFQDGVETDNSVFVMDGVDLGIGQKEVKSGATITDAEGVVGITSMDKPMDLELDKLMTFDKAPYTMTISDLSALEK